MPQQEHPLSHKRDLATSPQHKCVISGVGRSGTTFLVQLLTELGLDTGFADPQAYRTKYFEWANAGLEVNPLSVNQSPYIVKDPAFVNYIVPFMESGRFVLDHLYIPIRELDAAAMSRIDVSRRTGRRSGGMWNTNIPSHQKWHLAQSLYQLMYQVARFGIPLTMLEFPRIVHDPRYTYEKLTFLTGNIDFKDFLTGFERVAKPELVHAFSRDAMRDTLSSCVPIRVTGPQGPRGSRLANVSQLQNDAS